jgi:hypothetical protein
MEINDQIPDSEEPQAEGPAEECAPPADSEEAKRLAMRKRKPMGPVMKALSKEEIEAMLWDPETAERDHLLDALPKGWDNDYQDDF